MELQEMTKSIEKLEVKISYTEEIVAQLNEIVVNQQKEIGILNNHINKLEKKVAEIIEENEVGDLPNRRPPHY